MTGMHTLHRGVEFQVSLDNARKYTTPGEAPDNRMYVTDSGGAENATMSRKTSMITRGAMNSARQNAASEFVLCGTGNRALFGHCLATAGIRLQLHIDADRPVHPDMSFPVSVQKLDHYNQTVTSDSVSFWQVRAEPRILTGARGERSSVAAVVSGRTIFQLQGGIATINLAVRPFFLISSNIYSPFRLASEVALYVEGTDIETYIILR